MGVVDFGGIRRKACLAYVPEVELGDYVIVHVGFAISVVDQRGGRALATRCCAEMGNLEGIDLPDEIEEVRRP